MPPPTKKPGKKPIEQYDHKDKQRINNPPVGLVTPQTDPGQTQVKSYAYDPHLDPQLVWAGKAEHTAFSVPTVSLHVHERIDPRTIVEAVRRQNGSAAPRAIQLSLFDAPTQNPPLREAIEFYRHKHNWSNRLIAGDSLLVMNSLLEKEGLAGQVQMVYFDPPYGIKYGSNFQPFVGNRSVTDGKDGDLTQEPEMIKAFRDTWELGLHSYLTYMRDRLLLARELLAESGSIFVQISDENVHHIRELMDEVFGVDNFCALICFSKTGGLGSKLLYGIFDFILWYGRDKDKIKYRQLFIEKEIGGEGASKYENIELLDGTRRRLTFEEKNNPNVIPTEAKVFRLDNLTSQGNPIVEFEFEGKLYRGGWKTNLEGMSRLIAANRIIASTNTLNYVRYIDDFSAFPITTYWPTGGIQSRADPKIYVVQTATTAIQRCILMTTDPGDLVLDITCGSGTTAYVAEQWGRRWITCDTSRVAITLAKQRLMTALFDYYELAQPAAGVDNGFKYKSVPHVTLKSIANNPEIRAGMSRAQIEAAIAKYTPQETLYDQPLLDNSKARVSGPFTVEAVPAPVVKSLDEIEAETAPPQSPPAEGKAWEADASVSRSGETLRQAEWRAELLSTGIRAKGGQRLAFSRVEPLPGTRWLHADAETKEAAPQRVVVSFGPEHAPLEQRQVELAIEEAYRLVPKPKIVVFAAFQFDPEAAKDIDETTWPGVTLLKAQMNTDLLTEDLKKQRASNESFWLIGQPEVRLIRPSDLTGLEDLSGLPEFQVEVLGFDYYNPTTGAIESGGPGQIAMWLLDSDYDGRSLFPHPVFFPMAGPTDGWARLARNLKAEIDEDLIEAYRGTISLPFTPGKYRRIAIKIVDDRGIESLKIMEV